MVHIHNLLNVNSLNLLSVYMGEMKIPFPFNLWTATQIIGTMGFIWFFYRASKPKPGKEAAVIDRKEEEDLPLNGLNSKIEIHDALILHADKDYDLARELKEDLEHEVKMDGLNLVLYSEFAPEVQSHFKTVENLFQRCRYLFVLDTKNFDEDKSPKYLNGLALMDCIKHQRERIIPVKAEKGVQSYELSVLKGIDYVPRRLVSEQENTNFKTFQNLFDAGRKIMID